MFNRKKKQICHNCTCPATCRVRFISLNLLFADYASARTSSVHTFQTSVGYHTSSSFAHPSPPSLQLPQSTQITSMSSLSHLASLPSPSSSLDVMTRISTTRTADYAPAKKSSVHTFQTSVGYHTSSSFAHPFSLSRQLPQSTQITSTSSLSHSASLPSPSPSLDVMTRIQTTHTRKFSHMGTRSLQTRPALCTSRSILPLTLNTEVESLLPVSSEEVTNQVISTGIHTSSVNTGEPNYSEPSEVGFPIRKKLLFPLVSMWRGSSDTTSPKSSWLWQKSNWIDTLGA